MNHKHEMISRMVSLIILLLLSCILMAAPVLAEGTGDGSGGGQAVPLGLASSIPADGAKDVSLTSDIKLTFNKNVIYLAIRENNKKCFSLVAADGSKVPIEVIMADDQIHPEEKRNVSIHPLQEFKLGTAYTLKISPDLQAKNGTSLGHEAAINFVTAGTAVKPAPAARTDESVKPEETKPTPAADKSEVKNEASALVASEKATVAEEKTTVAENTQVAEDKTEQSQNKQVNQVDQVDNEEKNPVNNNPQGESKSNRTYAIIAGLVLIAGAGYLQRRKRMHK